MSILEFPRHYRQCIFTLRLIPFQAERQQPQLSALYSSIFLYIVDIIIIIEFANQIYIYVNSLNRRNVMSR